MIKNWLPVLLWTGLIFYFSTDSGSSAHTAPILGGVLSRLFPGVTAEQIAAVDLAVRKFGHWTEYFVLSALLLRALESGQRKRCNWGAGFWTLALVLIYGISDELHQAFVPSRSALVADVLIDLFGGVCGVLWMYALGKRRKARKQNRGDQRRDGS